MEKQKPTQSEALDTLQKMNVTYGEGSLAWYAQEGDAKMTELLLIAGINPNKYATSKNGRIYPLQNTCKLGHVACIALMLEYSGDINSKDDDGKAMLHIAIEKENEEMVKFLISKGADVNLLTDDSRNPLYIATKKNNEAVILLLKNAGAREMNSEEVKGRKKAKTVKVISVCVFLFICFGVGKMCTGGGSSNSNSSSSSSSSSVTHTCLNCGKTYTGFGYATIGGEEYALEKNQGDQYCSRACAKASRTGKFKNM